TMYGEWRNVARTWETSSASRNASTSPARTDGGRQARGLEPHSWIASAPTSPALATAPAGPRPRAGTCAPISTERSAADVDLDLLALLDGGAGGGQLPDHLVAAAARDLLGDGIEPERPELRQRRLLRHPDHAGHRERPRAQRHD